MNKYNFERTGFEVNRGARGSRMGCGCDSHSHHKEHHHAHEHEIKGSYGETLNRRAGETSCGVCKSGESRYGLTDRPVGSVYAPLQAFDGIYDPAHGLCRGTLFSALDLPLEVSKGGRCNG